MSRKSPSMAFLSAQTATNGKEVSRLEHEKSVHTVTFSPDGQYVATVSGNIEGDNSRMVRVFEARTGRELPRLEQAGSVIAVSFEGKYLVSLLTTGMTVMTLRRDLWRTEDMVSEVCSRVTRNLTKAEWHLYLVGEPYHKTCPNLPESPDIAQ